MQKLRSEVKDIAFELRSVQRDRSASVRGDLPGAVQQLKAF